MEKEQKLRELKERFLEGKLSVQEYEILKDSLEKEDKENNEEADSKAEKSEKNKMPAETKIGWAVLIVIILAVIVYGFFSVSGKAILNNYSSESGVQEINMAVDYTGYSPNSFVLKKGIPVKWAIDVKELSGCNSKIISQELGINKELQKGRNIIEFTPNRIGTISFGCAMGMLKGSFIVTESGTATEEQIASAKPASGSSCGSSGGSCGGGCGGCGGGSGGCGGAK